MNARRIALLAALMCGKGVGLAAQQPQPAVDVSHEHSHGWIAHYGKWAAAVLAGTFTALGAYEHQNSNRVYGQLVDVCRTNNSACALGQNGAYLNPATEQLYQTSLHYDSRARLRLVAGQVGLLLTAGLFLADLRHHESEPDNIPFHPAHLIVDPRADGTKLGFEIRF